MALPLAGVKVLEMGTFITGPAAGMMLADLGAEVIKIEQTGTGDPFRAFRGGLYSPHFQTYNRNKKSVTLDTRKAEDLASFDALLADADVFIQNFRPGVAKKLGVDAARLQGLNPRLVYGSISGFGSSGPDRDRPAFDTVAQAASGFLRLLLNPSKPRVVGPAIADAMTGFYAAQGILAALYERQVTGRGRLVETSMFEAMAHFNLDDFTHLLSDEQHMGPYSRPHVSQSYVFECADGKWLALHMSSPPKFWENLALAVEQPDMLAQPAFASREARIAHYEDVVPFLAPIFAGRSRAAWLARLTDLEVPSAAVATSAEVLASPQAEHLQLMVSAPGPMGEFRTIRSPISFDGERNLQVTAPPLLGADNATILGQKPER
ncbi:CoA transferase [Polymorphobacter multimanifer]|uniref:Crotonobetainyl-CoA:carnitine CoA-transferase CaiB-like acyl-CoA transferase n=1 Tax=Polymorphobacter multimanifer TaxID=1070431 RepID=A0A841L2Y2_9SPHN|nr:CaiB/BaiF CoA-transferase family protein [Polymorphobacter multimanifer]MBB6226780.1 crotonobetainyl-CoA:carnitine CoA-transferase CaiB-like acyl-CoA transferase [Polymorphobacter multimanifer]GGI87743.1 CoA transferase [Polymorphobacter multimanifer]